MSVKVATNRFIVSVSSLKKHAEFYQQLLTHVSDIQEVGNRLIKEAERAIAFCEVDKVEEFGLVLSNFPGKEYQLIGQFYLGWCSHQRGENARRIFEEVIENSRTCRGRALLSLAALEARSGDYILGVNYYSEAAKKADCPATLLKAASGIAAIKSFEGDHKTALNELESLAPLAPYATPQARYDYWNSLAVELGEVGRIEEAKHVSSLVLSSPFINAYPDWQETAKELALKSRSKRASFITIPAAQLELELEEKPGATDNVFAQKESSELGSVYLFPHRKKDTPRVTRPDAVSKYELMRMTIAEKRAMVTAVVYDHATREQDYEKILEAVGLVKEEELREIDLESRSELDDLVTDWCGVLGAEEFARVLSALWDCEDHWRVRNIIDTMIMFAFRESSSNMKSEAEWRERVSTRLKPEKKHQNSSEEITEAE